MAHYHIATNAAQKLNLIMMEGLVGAPRLEGLGSSPVEGLGLSRVEPKMRGWPEQPYYYPYYKDPPQGTSTL